MTKESAGGTGMKDRLGQAGGIMAFFFLLILYVTLLFIPAPEEQEQGTDRIRQQIREERMIQ